MKRLSCGVTRRVYQIGPWAVKLAGGGWGGMHLRGWMANRSEWRHRRRPDVVSPLFTLGHVITAYPLADGLATDDRFIDHWCDQVEPFLLMAGYCAEETKPSSWGLFNGRWLLLDYDAALRDRRHFPENIYYWNQERLGRKWVTRQKRWFPDS